MTRLTSAEIANRIESLRSSLTTMQAARLATLGGLVDADGRFLLRQALVEGEFPEGDARAQDAFREFRTTVNARARAAGVDLVLQLDSRKTSPDSRYGWFTGNPVERGLVAFTEGAAEQIGITKPVAPEVAELDESRRLRVHVSFHPMTGNVARSALTLIAQLTTALQVLDGQAWEVTDSRSVHIGENEDEARARLCTEADVCVSLINPAYLGSPERTLAFARKDQLVAVAFSGLPHGPIDLKPLQRHEIVLQDEPWDKLRGPQRTKYINELVREVQRVVSKPRISREHSDDDKSILKAFVARQVDRDDGQYFVPSELREAKLQESSLDHGDHRSTGTRLQAVDRLVSWATDEKPTAQRLCALLGDVGMGKTTTAKLFTLQLLELHENDPSSPLPVLFDLRDVRVSELTGAMSLNRILNDMLEATRPQGVPHERLNADTVRKQLETGRTVIVFDGLDEVLVHLTPHDRQLFTRQLWRALPANSAARMLLTCRTQYFRTIRDEADFFNGQTRQGLRGSDYLALLMLPFREEQIREYLAGNLGRDDAWVNGFLETIGAVHNLTELAQRPITLRLISDQVEFIETAKLEGRTLRSVDIYSEVVDRWISRDEGKHTLTPDHKRLLMEEIAAGLWRSGKNSWSPAEVDDWLLALLDERPDIRRHYREHVPDLWTADFRTATFLKREGNKFEFAHRSLFEYFLARYLYRNLSGQLDRSFTAFAMPVPSAETLNFLGQSIAADPEQALLTLESIGRRYRHHTSELALAYALHAAGHSYPRQSLIGVDLAGASLSGWIFGVDDTLALNDVNLSGSDLRDAVFVNVDLSGANLANADAAGAEFHKSVLARSKWHGANVAGAILRLCDISEVDLTESHTYRTQLLRCEPPPNPAPGLQVAPLPQLSDERAPSDAHLTYFSGYTGGTHTATWSPDNTRVLVGTSGGARIWDFITGEVLHQLDGSVGVKTVAWSPDNNRILTGDDSGARMWNAATGELLHQLTNPSRLTQCVAWSPDNTRIVIGDDDGAHIWNATTGELTLELDTAVVRAVAWSPDSTHIAIGDADGAHIRNATTGELTLELATAVVRAVAWSPDSTHIAIGDTTGAHIRNATTGKCTLELVEVAYGVSSVAWSPDSALILTSDDTGPRIWNPATGEPVRKLSDRTNWVRSVAWSPDNTRIITSDNSGSRIWNPATGELLHQLTNPSPLMQCVAWSPDKTRIITGDESGARVWDTTGELLHQLTNAMVNAVAWSPDNTRIITGDDDGAHVWNATTGKLILNLTDRTGEVNAVAWSPDNTRIITGDDDEALIFNAVTGELLCDLMDEHIWVRTVAWSPDNKRVITGDDSARIWNATTGELLHQLTNTVGTVNTVAWSPDNTRVVTGDNGCARIWDATTGELLHQLTNVTGAVNTVAWSPDNTRIITGDDGGARIWNATTGTVLGLGIALLPDLEYAVFDGPTRELIKCTEGAWRWIGWTATGERGVDRLPAETFGPLPTLPE